MGGKNAQVLGGVRWSFGLGEPDRASCEDRYLSNALIDLAEKLSSFPGFHRITSSSVRPVMSGSWVVSRQGSGTVTAFPAG